MFENPYSYWKGLEAAHEFFEENPGPEHHKQFIGMWLSSRHAFGTFLGSPWLDRYLTLPQKPSYPQKLIAFLAVKFRFVSFARRENDYIGYAFDINAKKVFSW